jgi:hypothetical protein
VSNYVIIGDLNVTVYTATSPTSNHPQFTSDKRGVEKLRRRIHEAVAEVSREYPKLVIDTKNRV